MTKVLLISEKVNFYKFKEGNERAFAFFFDIYYSKIVGFCIQYVGDQDTSNSIAQEAFIKLWVNRKKINKINGIKSFLYTAAKSECLNLLRHHKIVKKYKNQVLEEKENQLNLEILNSFECDCMSLIELEEKIEKSIEELPEKCKLVFNKSRKENKKNREISEELGISVKAVEADITRALKYLKIKLSHHYPGGVAGLF